MEADGAMKMWKTSDNASFPHFHSSLGNSLPAKSEERSSEFSTAPTGPTTGLFLTAEKQTAETIGEYPIDAWHGDNQCPSIPDELRPGSFLVHVHVGHA